VDLPGGRLWDVVLDPDDWLLDDTQRANLFSRLAGPLRAAPNPAPGACEFMVEYTGSGGEAGSMTVLDVQGRIVSTIDLGWIEPGSVRVPWDGTSIDGRRVSGGVYFARIQIGKQTASTRVLMLQ
jgi:hypothetical protein